MKKYSLIIVLFTFLFSSDKFITPEQSINYVGETETVCGEVVSTHYSTGSRGTPTFLNFDKREQLHCYLTDELKLDDVVLVKGSRGMKMEKTVEHIKSIVN